VPQLGRCWKIPSGADCLHAYLDQHLDLAKFRADRIDKFVDGCRVILRSRRSQLCADEPEQKVQPTAERCPDGIGWFPAQREVRHTISKTLKIVNAFYLLGRHRDSDDVAEAN
jgi:hypothetical protein